MSEFVVVLVPKWVILVLFVSVMIGFLSSVVAHRPFYLAVINGSMLLGVGGLLMRPDAYTFISSSFLLCGGAAFFIAKMWPEIREEFRIKPHPREKK